MAITGISIAGILRPSHSMAKLSVTFSSYPSLPSSVRSASILSVSLIFNVVRPPMLKGTSSRQAATTIVWARSGWSLKLHSKRSTILCPPLSCSPSSVNSVFTPKSSNNWHTRLSPCTLLSNKPLSTIRLCGIRAAMANQYDAALQSLSTTKCRGAQ